MRLGQGRLGEAVLGGAEPEELSVEELAKLPREELIRRARALLAESEEASEEARERAEKSRRLQERALRYLGADWQPPASRDDKNAQRDTG